MLIQPGYRFPNIKVLGIGGVGTQTIQEMEQSNRFHSVDFCTIGIQTDSVQNIQSIHSIELPAAPANNAHYKNSVDKWETIALDHTELIKEYVMGTEILFISCNLGRGFSTGVAPVVAGIAKDEGALVIAIVTEPFHFEGRERTTTAQWGVSELKKYADMVIPVSRQKLMECDYLSAPVKNALNALQIPLYDSIRIISDIVRSTQRINTDLADLRTIITNSSVGFIGEGISRGNAGERTSHALTQALSFPLTVNTINNARNILFSVSVGGDVTMDEIADVANTLTKSIGSHACIKFGVAVDEAVTNYLKITIVATDVQINDTPDTPQYSTDIKDNLNIPAFLRR